MKINPFKLERYFALYEFKVQYLLSPSDCESLSMQALLQMANAESLERWDRLSLGYTESPGHPVLRAEVADLYNQISPDNVIIAAPEEAIYLAIQTLLTPGDEVIVISPAYQSLYEIARSMGCKVIPWRLMPGAGMWQLDIHALASSINKQTRMVVLNFPHNPTGYLPSRNGLEEIVHLARENGLYIFSDEMYRMLEYDPSDQLPALCEIYEKGISLSGLSKSFALPGLRLGWLATRDQSLIERWLVLKDYITICNSAPSEALGIIALQAKEKIVNRNLAIIQDNLSNAERFFAKHQDRFRWFRPEAGSVAFPQWIGKGSVEEFCQDLLEKQGIMIVPGSIFEFPGEYFRIGLGRSNFQEALERLDRYLA